VFTTLETLKSNRQNVFTDSGRGSRSTAHTGKIALHSVLPLRREVLNKYQRRILTHAVGNANARTVSSQSTVRGP